MLSARIAPSAHPFSLPAPLVVEAAHVKRLMTELDAGRFAEDLLLVVDLNSESMGRAL